MLKILISQFLQRAETKNFSFKFYFTKKCTVTLDTKNKMQKKIPTARNSKASLNFISVDKLKLSILFFPIKGKLKIFLSKSFFNDYLLFPLAPNLKASIVLNFKLCYNFIRCLTYTRQLGGGEPVGYISFIFHFCHSKCCCLLHLQVARQE